MLLMELSTSHGGEIIDEFHGSDQLGEFSLLNVRRGRLQEDVDGRATVRLLPCRARPASMQVIN